MDHKFHLFLSVHFISFLVNCQFLKNIHLAARCLSCSTWDLVFLTRDQAALYWERGVLVTGLPREVPGGLFF